MTQEKKETKSEEGENNGKEGGKRMGEGIFISKKSLWLMAGGALGAIAALGLGKTFKKIRPAVIGAVKEGYAFKEWVAAKIETVKEDIEDIVAEAKHSYHKDLEASAEAVKKEKEIIEKVEQLVGKKMSRKKAAREGE
ncbi:hypothetical protein [Dissulfurispira sp.]|uniref:hypothetical protein n=1 Tax=Dissulfurispira sp. TaxID=2817609 RepID=UPI002FD88966